MPKVLKIEWDTRPLEHEDPALPGLKVPGYTGQQIGDMTRRAAERAAAEGYDEFEFKWWDWLEGWVTARGKVKAAKPAP